MMGQLVHLIRIVLQMEIVVAILHHTTELQDAQLQELMPVERHSPVTKIISWIIQVLLVKLNLLPTKKLEREVLYLAPERVF